jgi:Cytochrome c oxidase subunit III
LVPELDSNGIGVSGEEATRRALAAEAASASPASGGSALSENSHSGVYDRAHYFGLTAGTLYWHFVDVIWVLLFFLFYLW